VLKLAFFLTAVVCSASSIGYGVNMTVGVGSVVGYIVTDGTIGGLSQSDITGWNLLINDGTGTFDLTSLNSQVDLFTPSPSDLAATSTQLFFNFSSGSGFLLFQSPTTGSGGPAICFEADITCSNEPAGVQLYATTLSNQQFKPLGGDLPIGTNPEPESVGMLVVGLAALGAGISWKRRHS